MQEAKKLSGEGGVTVLRRLKLEFRKGGLVMSCSFQFGLQEGKALGQGEIRNRLT